MASILPSACTTLATHKSLKRSPDCHSLVNCSRSSSVDYHPGSDGISRKTWTSYSPPWSGLVSTSGGNENQSAYLGKKKQGLRSPFCYEVSSCGVDYASCCSSSRDWNVPSAAHVGRGCPGMHTDGLAHNLCKLVMVAGYSRIYGFQVGRAWSRKDRRKRFTKRIPKNWQFSHEVAAATQEGRHLSLSESKGSTDGQFLLPSVVEDSRRTKSRGLRPAPIAFSITTDGRQYRSLGHICSCSSDDHNEPKLADAVPEGKSVDNLGVQMALALLRFYKREISPYIPASCRYVPTCSEYSQQAYRKYGFVKGSILTAWRLARCNPLGSSGFDPPRWFGEEKPPQA